MTDKAPVTVEQGDREAAALLIEAYWRGNGNAARDMQRLARSYRDGHTQGLWAKAFAKHRLQSIAALEEEIKRLREALERIGWHELTAREARDIARTALEGRGS